MPRLGDYGIPKEFSLGPGLHWFLFDVLSDAFVTIEIDGDNTKLKLAIMWKNHGVNRQFVLDLRPGLARRRFRLDAKCNGTSRAV